MASCQGPLGNLNANIPGPGKFIWIYCFVLRFLIKKKGSYSIPNCLSKKSYSLRKKTACIGK